jgi:uncharacterized protein DUF4384
MLHKRVINYLPSHNLDHTLIKKIIVFFLLNIMFALLCLTNLKPALGEADNNNANICFQWAFGALVEEESNRKLISVTPNSILKTGDELKIYIKLECKCFVYLIYQGSKGDILALFPSNINQYTEDLDFSNEYYIPEGNNWFEVDSHLGVETFYLIGSSEKLENLEKLISHHQSYPDEINNFRSSKIIVEIKKIIRKNRKLTASAERPVTIGGTVRELKNIDIISYPDVASLATQITASDFFIRTFRIEHK